MIIPDKKPWKNEFENLPIYDFKSLNETKVFLDLLSDFQKLGFVIVKNTSAEEGTVIKFAEMFGPVRTTNFGKHFDVVSKPDPNDLAYTSLGLTGPKLSANFITAPSAFGNYVQSRFSGRLDFVTYLEPKKLEKYYSARRKIFNLYASNEFLQ